MGPVGDFLESDFQQLQALLEEHGQSLHSLVEQHEVLERRQAHLTQDLFLPGDGGTMRFSDVVLNETCL